MDILADILKALKLRGTVYFHASFHAPWGMKIPRGEFASFHIITAGGCWLRTDSHQKPVRLEYGDILIFPRGDSHSLCHEPDAEPVMAKELLSRPRQEPEESADVAFGGDGAATTHLICGHFEYDREYPHVLFETLDDCLHIQARLQNDPQWSLQASQLAASLSTANTPGGGVVLDRLAETLFIHALVAHVNALEDRDNFLLALHDQNLGRALKLMHDDPAQNWKLEDLAAACYMSRSVFADKFKRMVGVPPMVYLARWRMLKARGLLANTQLSMARIAEQVGYQSPFAFAKAFKKIVGQAPGAVRREAQA
ncbi:MAG: AraC family transcriptional regulator [Wenzhouxiangellaceae bacterium]